MISTTYIIVIVLVSYFMQQITYDYIKKKYPKIYNNLGRPDIHKLQNSKVFFGLFLGKTPLPNDKKLKKYVLLFRICEVILIVVLILVIYSIVWDIMKILKY